MKDIRFNKQFVMMKSIDNDILNWDYLQIADYKLFFHPELIINECELSYCKVVLLGDIYDYRNYKSTNQEIIRELAESTNSFMDFVRESYKYSGTYVILYFDKKDNSIFLYGDSTNQREVYYINKGSSEMVVGSQPNIINLVMPMYEDNDIEAYDFYSSKAFASRKTYVGEVTNYVGLKHLKPNHFIDIQSRETIRFFPDQKLSKISLSIATEKAVMMIRGYIKAAAERYPLLVPVSAGWDSRVLLSATKDIADRCTYFVYKHPHMSDSNQDVVIPQQLFKKLGIDFSILEYSEDISTDLYNQILESLPFPRKNGFKYIINVLKKDYPDHLCLNGNVSEIVRKYYERIYNLTPKKIAFLQKYPESKYAIHEYEKWISASSEIFDDNNFSISDMLYWEENCGNWAAKGKSEVLTASELFSPFNSRELLVTLLSVDEKYRDKQNPVLYKHIIKYLWEDVLQVPVNPSFKIQVIKALHKIGIYTYYRNILLNFSVFVKSLRNSIT